MATISGMIRDSAGDPTANVAVRAYRRDTGALLGATLSQEDSTYVAGDPYFADVTALLHFEGANNSSVFTDSGPNSLTFTKTGSPIISTAQYAFGAASGYFSSSSYISSPVTATQNFLGKPFTIEMRVRPDSLGGSGGAFFSTRIGAVYAALEIRQHYGAISVFIGNAAINSWASTSFGRAYTVLSTTNFVDICLVGDGSTIYYFADGVLKETIAQPAWTPASGNIYLGRGGDAAITGNIDEFRFTAGTARQTESYTIAAAAFPDYAEIPPGVLGHYEITTAYTGEAQVIALSPDVNDTFSDQILRVIPG